MNLPQTLIRIARAELGTTEQGGANIGPRVDIYKAATGLDSHGNWAWCAAFVCWCIREAAAKLPKPPVWPVPTTARAFGLEAWADAHTGLQCIRRPIVAEVQPGDVLVYTFSHCGIAEGRIGRGDLVQAIEGNTNTDGSRDGIGVFQRARNVRLVRSLIRLA